MQEFESGLLTAFSLVDEDVRVFGRCALSSQEVRDNSGMYR